MAALSHGIWRLIDDDLSRYGEGGVEATVYAMTLLAQPCQHEAHGIMPVMQTWGE